MIPSVSYPSISHYSYGSSNQGIQHNQQIQMQVHQQPSQQSIQHPHQYHLSQDNLIAQSLNMPGQESSQFSFPPPPPSLIPYGNNIRALQRDPQLDQQQHLHQHEQTNNINQQQNQYVLQGNKRQELPHVSPVNYDLKPDSRVLMPVAPQSPSQVPGSLSRGSSISNMDTLAQQRKKFRRSDHAPIGDPSDHQLLELAFRAKDQQFDEFIESVKFSEKLPAESTKSSSKGNKIYEIHKKRQQQIFAMVCLMKMCEPSSTSVVPRNLIFSKYSHICSSKQLTALCAASFGKLVRILFPSVTTRRLGMRGESRYHYCGIRLIDDKDLSHLKFEDDEDAVKKEQFDGNIDTSDFSETAKIDSRNNVHNNFNNSDKAVEPSKRSIKELQDGFTVIKIPKTDQHLELVFQRSLLPFLESSEVDENLLSFPNLDHYINNDDREYGTNLGGFEEFYTQHCLSVFESFRYMRLKTLFDTITSFHNSLSESHKALYRSNSILSWIVECDKILYKASIRMLSKLTLKLVHESVREQLHTISSKYCENLSSLNFPKYVIDAKCKPAVIFSKLIGRIARVSDTAESANRVLSSSDDREMMLMNWRQLVNFKNLIDKELPCSSENSEIAQGILQNDIPYFIEQSTKQSRNANNPPDVLISNLCKFLVTLPFKFVNSSSQFFILCSSTILTAALREISLAGGQGFGAWWVVRCWVDEWHDLCAELGGYFKDDLNKLDEEEKGCNNRSSISSSIQGISYNLSSSSDMSKPRCEQPDTIHHLVGLSDNKNS
ncbi:unnamed protein product [[Candida] boidinii]|nr:unnamed protein product [[Candida] boidinii]